MRALPRYRPFGALLGGLVLTACPERPSDGESASDSGSGSNSASESGSDSLTASGSSGDPSTGDTSEDPTTGTIPPDEAGPREGPWEVIVDALPFPIADIHRLNVGRKEFNENFANRGVVEVLFDHDEETITIETREYVFGDAAAAANAFDHLSLWAFVLEGDPTHNPDPADDCTKDVWKDNCAIYARYDGKSQPARTGMDLRVHLPRGWRGWMVVETEDNLAEESWPRRGDVRIVDLCSNAEVFLEAGHAAVRMCRELSPAPTCPPDQIADCEVFPDGTGSEAWSPECACGIDQFGLLSVHSPQPWAANIIVDVPDDTWLNAVLSNHTPTQPHDCQPQIDNCEAPACALDDADENSLQAVFNHPSPAAFSGAGFHVLASVGDCTLVPFAEPGAPDQPPQEELRGFVRMCTDCL